MEPRYVLKIMRLKISEDHHVNLFVSPIRMHKFLIYLERKKKKKDSESSIKVLLHSDL